MSGYVTVHKIGEREIFVDIRKKRVYAKLHWFLSEGLFWYGQSAVDSVLAIFAVAEPDHIDYILDMGYCEALPEEACNFWKKSYGSRLQVSSNPHGCRHRHGFPLSSCGSPYGRSSLNFTGIRFWLSSRLKRGLKHSWIS
jgi:hypothetical protein